MFWAGQGAGLRLAPCSNRRLNGRWRPCSQDSFGRVATDLRVSLTDRCNLRCSYCMPPEGLDWLPKPDLLTADEIVRLVAIGVERLGITEVRYTGGEPLLRRELVDIVARTAALRPRAAGVADHQRHRAGPAAPAARRRGPGPGQRLARHPRPRDVQDARPPRPARGHARGAGGRRTRPGCAGQGQRGADARRQRPRGRAAAALLPGARLRAAVHRADAAGRPARLAAGEHGHCR